MPHIAQRGPLGTCLLPQVDSGTLVRAASALPGVLGFDDTPVQWARRELQRGLWQGVHWVEQQAVEAALAELRALRHDVQAMLALIAGLPDSIRRRVAYEAFAAFFTHDLPKKFLQHYVWGRGAPLTLSQKEMVDCNPYVNLPRSKSFLALLSLAAKTPRVPVPLAIDVAGAALTNGTLGQFTVHCKGTLRTTGPGTWEASGQMDFYDKWDFDPKDFATGGRSFQGEVKTRVANRLLPGDGFEITSPAVAFSQTDADAYVTWVGGAPQAELDRIAALDAALAKSEQ